MSERITHTYHSPTDDFVETKNQGHALPADYEWVRDGAGSRCASAVLYAAGLVFAFFLYPHPFAHAGAGLPR